MVRGEPAIEEADEFDVFLAHNSDDKAAVEWIADRLRQHGVNPWLDKEQIPPGQWFQDVIQNAIGRVKAAAIFFGPNGLGRWQQLELRAFTRQCVESGRPVIPVLLPQVLDLPPELVFLRELNWVRFQRLDDPDALKRLIWGISSTTSDAAHRRSVSRLDLREVVDKLEQALLDRQRDKTDEVRRGLLTAQIDELVARVMEAGRVGPGSSVAGTTLVRTLSSGNFGTVWLAKRNETGELAATKVFHLEKLTEGVMLWRFRRSIRAMRRLREDRSMPLNIVRVFDESDDSLAFSMEYLPEGNLEDIASRGWTLDKKLEIFAAICRAVEFAHRGGVIHRDIKPANVVLNAARQPVLTDFDIADIRFVTKLSVAEGGLGTAVFAAPEQLEDGDKADERSDIYSLGRLLYYFLLDRSPGYIERDPSLDNLRNVPLPLATIVRRATQWEPARRYSSVAGLIREVERYQTAWARLRARALAGGRWVRKNVALLLVLVMVVGGSVGFGVYQRHLAQNERAMAEMKQKTLEERERLERRIAEILGSLDSLRRENQRLTNLTEIAANEQKQEALHKKLKELQGSLAGQPGARTRDEDFKDVTYLDVGQSGGDATLDKETIENVMNEHLAPLRACALHEHDARVEIQFIIKGSGAVSAVKVNGARNSPLSSCIFAAMRTFRFPRFDGTETIAWFRF